MRERSAEADVRARGLKEYESKINVDEYIKKAFIETAKSNDAFDYNVRAAQVARESGDEAKAKDHYGRAYELALPNLTAKMNALKGKATEQDFAATMEAFGEDGVEKLMSEAGTNQRANAQLPIQKQQAATSAGNLALEKEKEARKLTGQVPQDDYYKLWHTKIEGVKRIVLGFKDAYSSPDTSPQDLTTIKSIMGSVGIKPTEFLKTLADLNRMDTKAMTGRFNPNEEKWLDQFGGFGENNPMPETIPEPIPGAKAGVSSSVGAGSTVARAEQPLSAPPQQAGPKIEQTSIGPVAIGEIRTSPKDGKQYRYLGNNQWTPAQ
jgi:hypothetical protein